MGKIWGVGLVLVLVLVAFEDGSALASSLQLTAGAYLSSQDKVGVAFLVRYTSDDGSGTPADGQLEVTDTTGFKYTISYKAGMKTRYFVGSRPASAGVYRVTGIIGGQTLSASFNLSQFDLSSPLPKPGGFFQSKADGSSVTFSWDKVNGAAVYQVNLFDSTANQYADSVVWTAQTTATLSGLNLDSSHKYLLMVSALSTDLSPDKRNAVEFPALFKVSAGSSPLRWP